MYTARLQISVLFAENLVEKIFCEFDSIFAIVH